MSLQLKYSSLLSLAQQLGVKDVKVEDAAGVLNISGTANTQYEKNVLWDKIKELGGEAHSDIKANINVAVSDYYHKHTVASGENLSKIAKHYYKDANKYMSIFNANKDKLTNPDLIKVGQELIIPNP